jgi:hypothetical protein
VVVGFVYRHPQYIEETSFGQIPSNPNLNWIGPSESWDPRSEIPPIQIRQLGSEDPRYLLRGQENYTFILEHFMQASTWIKYAINPQGGGSGSIDKSLSLAAGLRMGGAAGSVYYYQMLGCRPRSITLTGRINEAIRARMELTCRQIPTPNTTDPAGTGSWASDPGIIPWIFSTGGIGPVQVDSSPVPCTEISITVDRNPESIFVLGSGLLEYLPPKQRAITGTMTLVWNSQNRYTDLQNYTDRTITWKLSSLSTFTLNMCKFHRLDSFTIRPTDVAMERWAFTALNASIS